MFDQARRSRPRSHLIRQDGVVDTDLELLDRWCRGDREAGNQIFQRYFDSIYRFFDHKVGRDPHTGHAIVKAHGKVAHAAADVRDARTGRERDVLRDELGLQ
jgi:hypothetical protein